MGRLCRGGAGVSRWGGCVEAGRVCRGGAGVLRRGGCVEVGRVCRGGTECRGGASVSKLCDVSREVGRMCRGGWVCRGGWGVSRWDACVEGGGWSACVDVGRVCRGGVSTSRWGVPRQRCYTSVVMAAALAFLFELTSRCPLLFEPSITETFLAHSSVELPRPLKLHHMQRHTRKRTHF